MSTIALSQKAVKLMKLCDLEASRASMIFCRQPQLTMCAPPSA